MPPLPVCAVTVAGSSTFNTRSSGIYVDTSTQVVLDGNDVRHSDAVAVWAELLRAAHEPFTTNYVLVETVAPAQTLTDREYQRMRDAARKVMSEIGIETGGSNVQFAVDPKTGRMVIIEMNPRVSRSSALASPGWTVISWATR